MTATRQSPTIGYGIPTKTLMTRHIHRQALHIPKKLANRRNKISAHGTQPDQTQQSLRPAKTKSFCYA